jgi:HK97 gp10 family phage protein
VAAKKKLKVTSNFKACKGASDEAISELVRKATDAMEETTKDRIAKTAGRRGYNLSPDQVRKDVTDDEGTIRLEEFYWRFFEYGTTRIAAMPSLRPGHRAGRKIVKNDAGEIFEKWMRRKAAIKR